MHAVSQWIGSDSAEPSEMRRLRFGSWLVYVKATLVGDEREDVCHYHRAHPAFRQERSTISSLTKRSGRATAGSARTSAIAC
jgi:hypothetical protein